MINLPVDEKTLDRLNILNKIIRTHPAPNLIESKSEEIEFENLGEPKAFQPLRQISKVLDWESEIYKVYFEETFKAETGFDWNSKEGKSLIGIGYLHAPELELPENLKEGLMKTGGRKCLVNYYQKDPSTSEDMPERYKGLGFSLHYQRDMQNKFLYKLLHKRKRA
jgi:hypothetical protein